MNPDVINVLRFLGMIDEEGNKVESKTAAFVQHKDEEFQKQFESVVREAYDELFELHGDAAWSMDRASLVQFFRTTDHSSEIVGGRQAGTFAYLSALAGHGEAPQAKETSSPRAATKSKPRAQKEKAVGLPSPKPSKAPTGGSSPPQMGLTVRIEVNLPADGDQQTYDRIFRSIRKNLIDGE